MSVAGDLWTVRQALSALPDGCRYHGSDFRASGMMGARDNGRPRCDSCHPVWLRACAEAAVERLSEVRRG